MESMSTPKPSTRSRDALTTICIAANAITAGSIFCFPLFGPSFTRDLGLSLTQTNTIWVGAVMGEYVSAAFWGIIADRYGPRLLSLCAALLFGTGYAFMALADRTAASRTILNHGAADDLAWHSPSGYAAMSLYFVLVGAGVASSYFSTVIAATRLAPSYPGLAISIPLTLFSLSSLVLSKIGTAFFVDPATGELNTPSFLSFLAALLFIVNLVGAAGLRTDAPVVLPVMHEDDEEDEVVGEADTASHADETSSLLPNTIRRRTEFHALPGAPKGPSFKQFVAAPSVWALSFLLFTAVGGSEMVMSSIGAMTVSLLGRLGDGGNHALFSSTALARGVVLAAVDGPGSLPGSEALQIRSQQVQLLALANTLSRLLAGVLSDLLSPRKADSLVQDAGPTSRWAVITRRRSLPTVSRVSILLASSLALLLAFAYAGLLLRSPGGLSLLSLLVGTGYGLCFAIVPSIMATAYGIAQFGRNWGLASYACAAGSLAYSILFAYVSDHVAVRPSSTTAQATVCLEGARCFRPSFAFAFASLLAAVMPLLPLWRAWRKYV